MHRLLKRQLRRLGAQEDGTGVDLEALLALVSKTYEDYERDQRLATRASRLMEEELQELHAQSEAKAKEKFQIVLDASGDGVAFVDGQGIIQNVNSTLLHQTGFRKEEILGQSVHILTEEQQLTRYCCHNPQVVLGYKKGGRTYPITLRCVDLLPLGVPQRAIFLRDVTDREEAKSQLDQEQTMFRDFAETVSDWFWETDEFHRFTRFWGETALLNVSSGNGVIGKTRYEVMLANNSVELAERHQAVLDAHQPFRDFTYKYRDAQGEMHHFSISGHPLFAADGRFLGYRGAASNVTERVMADKNLMTLERRLYLALSAISEGIVLYDEHDKVVMCNDHFLFFYGFMSRDDVVGKTFLGLVQRSLDTGVLDMENASVEEWMQRRLQCHRAADGQVFLYKHMSGKWIQCEEYKTPEGGILGIHSDVTERVLLENELQTQITHANAANDAKTSFLANMSHEIRTPLNAVIGLSHLLMNESLPLEVESYVSKILASSQQLLNIVNDILDFSKNEAGKLKLEHKPFELDEVIEQASDIMQVKATEKGLQLSFKVRKEVPQALCGDPVRLLQVLINLVGNAIKFTDRGRVEVTVTVKETYMNRICLSFAVSDTGIGLSREQAQKLFQPFTQADTSTTRKYGGTGLGLAICKQIVTQMAGDIAVDSVLGQGSTFSFYVWFDFKEEKQSPPALRGGELAFYVVEPASFGMRSLAHLVSDLGVYKESYDTLAAVSDVLSDVPQQSGTHTIIIVHSDCVPDQAAWQKFLDVTRRLPVFLVPIYASSAEKDVKSFMAAVPAGRVLVAPVSRATFMGVMKDCRDTFLGAAPQSTTRPHQQNAQAPLLHAHVLLAEDNKINQIVAHEILQAFGLSIDVAENGQQAIDMCRAHAYDLVLLDVQMPVLDGVQAVQRIRELPNYAKTPILAMTAHARLEDRQRCLDAGMDDHIIKPVTPRELYEKLHPHLAVMPKAAAKIAANVQQSAAVVLDTETALARMNGNQRIYHALLEEFMATYQPERIAMLVGGDGMEYRNALHSLKGVAGNIGCMDLCACISDLEKRYQDRLDPPSMKQLMDSLGRALQAMQAYLQGDDVRQEDAARCVPQQSAESVPEGELKTQLIALQSALSLGETDALYVVHSLQKILAGTPLLASINEIAADVADFEFDAAEEKLSIHFGSYLTHECL